MPRHSSRSPAKAKTIAALFACLTATAAARTAPAEEVGGPPRGCSRERCLALEYEEVLEGEAATLADALSIRLARSGLGVVMGQGGSGAEDSGDRSGGFDWVVHLRQISPDLVLLAVDNLDTEGEDVVKEVQRGETLESTAWTMAIMVEEAIYPYLGSERDEAALGAGLSIIEPAVVGGVKRQVVAHGEEYPQVRSIGLALTVYGITESASFVAGPRLSVEGLFARRVIASISLAWAGWADFVGHGVNGSMSLMPLDVMIDFLLLPDRLVELSVSAGLAVGFAIYKTTDGERDRTDLLFEPCGQARLRAIFHIVGPWTIYVDGGLAVPFVKDVLKNNGEVVYEQAWGFPVFNIGVQVWL
jgi:hypothetical protein